MFKQYLTDATVLAGIIATSVLTANVVPIIIRKKELIVSTMSAPVRR